MAAQSVLVIDDSPTILRVVERLLGEAGYEVRSAGDGAEGLRLAEERRPDLVLLDFVMPGMNGYEVGRALAESPGLRGVPVVLLSAKAGEVGERFVRTVGAAGFLAKPFTSEALHLAVRRGLAPVPAATSGPSSLPTRAEDDDTSTDPLPRGVGAGPTDDDEAALSGRIARVPIAGVLALLAEQKQTGVLAVVRDQQRVEVWLRDGRVEHAGGEGLAEELQLGSFVLERGTLTAEALEALIAASPGRGLLGQRLVDAGAITPEELREALGRQARERIFEVLRWTDGRFAFRATDELGEAARAASLRLPMGEILLEGAHRNEQWHPLDRVLDDPGAVFVRTSALDDEPPAGLDEEALAVLALVDGRNTVHEVARQRGMTDVEVSRILLRLGDARLVRPRVRPVAV